VATDLIVGEVIDVQPFGSSEPLQFLDSAEQLSHQIHVALHITPLAAK